MNIDSIFQENNLSEARILSASDTQNMVVPSHGGKQGQEESPRYRTLVGLQQPTS